MEGKANLLRPLLYAEDNPNDIELTLAAFRTSGLDRRIDVVRDGRQVMDYLQRTGDFSGRPDERPALILLDIKMPRLDGIDALRFIKGDDRFRSIPTVMLTASAMESDLRDCYLAGANGFVIKPVDFNEFLESIRTIASYWIQVNKTL